MNLDGVFAWPEGLPILLLAPCIWFVLRALDARRERRVSAMLGKRRDKLTAGYRAGRRRFRRWCAISGAFFMLLALLQPLWGTGTREVEQRGVDVLICLDVSRSMLARDLSPDRLGRARQEIRKLAEHARGDRLGLVVFAGEARLAAPLTRDLDSLLELLDLADPTSVTRGGTDLAAALDLSAAALKGSRGEHEAVVLMSDGEDHEARGRRAAEVLSSQGITVHCIGLGSAHGSKIPVPGADGEEWLRDGSGAEVVTALVPTDLKSIAEVTGGDYLDATESAQPLLDLYDRRILPMARKAFETEERRSRKNRFQWPLLLAFLLWLLEFGLADGGRRR